MRKEKFSQTISLSNEVVKVLRDRILEGEYDFGERMMESQIADELMVSRTPVREAFKELEKEGLVTIVPNRGAFAVGLTQNDISDIYTVRMVVEALAVEWAVDKINDRELENLKEALERMEFYTLKKDSERVSENNKIFHETIYNASGSRFLAQILKSYQDYVEKTRKVTVYREENLPIILAEHKSVFEAMEKRDKKKAVERISKHLENSKKRTEESIKLYTKTT